MQATISWCGSAANHLSAVSRSCAPLERCTNPSWTSLAEPMNRPLDMCAFHSHARAILYAKRDIFCGKDGPAHASRGPQKMDECGSSALECQSVYYSLLVSMKDVSAPCYLRTWMQTEPCDRFADLSDVRKDIERSMGPAAMRRVLDFEEDARDRSRAVSTAAYYRKAHTARLLESLPWPTRAYYRLIIAPLDATAKFTIKHACRSTGAG